MNQTDFTLAASIRIEKQMSGLPSVIRNVILHFLRKILYLREINKFLALHSHLDTKQLINEFFDYLNFSYLISSTDLPKIPSEGKLICVSNHPLGSLDSLALIKIFLEVRSDVKIVANEILDCFENLQPVLIPIDLGSKISQRKSISEIYKTLENEGALIVFPAASVSRLHWFRVADSKWNKGAVHLAKKFETPILPIHINGKNSILFYFVSLINKKISTILLARELFRQRNKSIHIKIGDCIPAKVFTSAYINDYYQTKLLKKHVYNLAKNGKKIYLTEKNVIHPVDRKAIKSELNNAQLIGFTKNGMKIFIANKSDFPQTMNEIARLRELTFRRVGEGTGKKLDIDKYDNFYNHLIVWDENELEIVGAYRIGVGSSLLERYGKDGFYTSSLFEFSNKYITNYMPYSIELGRSFVQKKYWNTNALNYLWQGIGAFLSANEDIKYLFGGVSISNHYSEYARGLIVYYFKKWFQDPDVLAYSKNKFLISERKLHEYEEIFKSSSAKEDFKALKGMLRPLGYSIPPLYKHYSDLCEKGGVRFLDFGIDPSFENCIDGLILVDIALIKPEKKYKFIENKLKDDYALAVGT